VGHKEPATSEEAKFEIGVISCYLHMGSFVNTQKHRH
jgi:hypothetical protein